MSDYRRHKKNNYTCIDNQVFKDHSLSMKAKGLLTQIYSLPDNWEYSVRGLSTLFSDGREAVNNALQELIEHGYIIRTQKTNQYGKFAGYEYDIYETPQTKVAEKPFTENPITENPITENQAQLNTNISNTNILNTKDIYREDKPGKNIFVPPTLEEIKAYCKERNNKVDPQQFFDYYSTGEWKDAKGNPVKNWKQKIITWEKQNADARPRSKGYKSSAWVTGEEAGIVFNDNKTVDPEPSNDDDIPEDILNMFGE